MCTSLESHIKVLDHRSLQALVELKNKPFAKFVACLDSVPVVNTLANCVHLLFWCYFKFVPSKSDYARYVWKKGPLEMSLHIIPVISWVFAWHKFQLMHSYQMLSELKLPSLRDLPYFLRDSEAFVLSQLAKTKKPELLEGASSRLKKDRHFILQVFEQLDDVNILKYVDDELKAEVVDDSLLDAFPDLISFMPNSLIQNYQKSKLAKILSLAYLAPITVKDIEEDKELYPELDEGLDKIRHQLEQLVNI